MISAVPSASYKVPTGWLKDGCVCVNVASEKNFEKDVREKVRSLFKMLCLCFFCAFYFFVCMLFVLLLLTLSSFSFSSYI